MSAVVLQVCVLVPYIPRTQMGFAHCLPPGGAITQWDITGVMKEQIREQCCGPGSRTQEALVSAGAVDTGEQGVTSDSSMVGPPEA